MRRTVFSLSLLGAFLCSASIAVAQRACILAPDGRVICGPIVQPPGYRPPAEYDGPRPYYDNRGDRYDRDRRYRDDERRYNERDRNRPLRCPPNYTVQDGKCKPYHPPPTCQKGYTVQGGKCKPYHPPPKCQKGYTVQDGVCKPYTGR
jgi:hypothetical protein